MMVGGAMPPQEGANNDKGRTLRNAEEEMGAGGQEQFGRNQGVQQMGEGTAERVRKRGGRMEQLMDEYMEVWKQAQFEKCMYGCVLTETETRLQFLEDEINKMERRKK